MLNTGLQPSAPVLNFKDLTTANITPNVLAINSSCANPRTKFLIDRLVTHLHDYARETRLTQAEWATAIQFLVEAGQISNASRQELILLSDILGLSVLVDGIDHPTPKGATEGTVLGPFHVDNVASTGETELGGAISHDDEGEGLLVVGTVKDTQGNPISGVEIDVWETDSKGFYDVQYKDREPDKFDGRAVLKSDDQGRFWFRAIVPVPYPIPDDGPVGRLLKGTLKRHVWRPAHMHFLFKKEGWEPLITALYVRGSPYETTDAVFGVKESLIVDIGKVSDRQGFAEEYGASPDMKLLTYDFVLAGIQETADLRRTEAQKVADADPSLGVKVLDNGVLVRK
ncbi:Intradiol ring-cleavage dioxygenase [Microdochium trichocladiopsis]|uniref:Intradiol ring-cleavage dioxygenase n=1 Tax=Microdochium trichocladiopsis TaxID=1682393 RepID=A0A9P8Y4I4_9PEZI|nr:Intradiol ring-cleavage dioxygenase [Microdochium trichocladiopsis]KAH7029583.1 Intradiol ring-cleavage dioxygenase [Microdochium trichocladiopsis]